MDIPFYSDIYSFPGNGRHFHHWHRKPHFKRSQIVETSKEAAISDATGNIRYIVRLVSEPIDGELGFKVQVVHCYPTDTEEDNSLLLTIPSEGVEKDYARAQKDFNTCVQRYDSLVKAETKDFRDIDVYKDKIGYYKNVPDCCMFCRWSQVADICQMPMSLDQLVIECHNPDNSRKFKYMVDAPLFGRRHTHRYCNDSWQKLPWMQENPFRRVPFREDDILDRIFPRVDPFGKCNGFEKIEEDASTIEKPHYPQCPHCHQQPMVPNDVSLENEDDALEDALDGQNQG